MCFLKQKEKGFLQCAEGENLNNLINFVDRIEPELVEVWHTLHQNPELSMQEYKTFALLERQLRETTHCDRIHKVGETGIWAELKGTKPGNSEDVIILRGDMDALPIQEETDLPYRSVIPNVMHACGHDVHSSILLGAVRVLEQYRDKFAGSIWFFFQPGEEAMRGALTFLADPEIDFSRVKVAAATHAAGDIAAGKIKLKSGTVLASPDEVNFTVKGKNGHAASPHKAVDAIVAAAALVLQLQTLVSRETSPVDCAVLSLGTICGGTKSNIVANKVRIEGTLRTLSNETRCHLHESIRRIAAGVALATGTDIDVEIIKGPSSLYNDPNYTELAGRAVIKTLGSEAVVYAAHPNLAGEDFAYITENIPGVFIFVGAADAQGQPAVGHTPYFYTDRAMLRTGVIALSAFALEFFKVNYTEK